MVGTLPPSAFRLPPSEAPPVIHAAGLRKAFGRTVAVADLDLAVADREIFGLVGPDGAGKTTTFRLLLGLLVADRGKVRIGGYDLAGQAEAARAQVGYVAQAFTLYGDLSIAENIQFVGELYGIPAATYEVRARELLELTELAPFTERRAGDLSGGMRRKLALICALLHRPRILFLDEPTTGIDPVSRREFWRLLYGLPAEGVTLLVSTPFLDEAERCHRLGFMTEGQLLALDTPEGLLRRMPDALVEVRTEARLPARRLLNARAEVRRVETVGGSLRVALDPDAASGGRKAEGGRRKVEGWLAEAGIAFDSCEVAEPTLADVFSALSDRVGNSP